MAGIGGIPNESTSKLARFGRSTHPKAAMACHEVQREISVAPISPDRFHARLPPLPDLGAARGMAEADPLVTRHIRVIKVWCMRWRR